MERIFAKKDAQEPGNGLLGYYIVRGKDRRHCLVLFEIPLNNSLS